MGQIKIPQPEKFDGKTGKWEEWHLLIKSFISTVNPRYKELMDWAEKQTDEITDQEVTDYEQLTRMRTETMLSMKTLVPRLCNFHAICITSLLDLLRVQAHEHLSCRFCRAMVLKHGGDCT